MSEKFRCPFKGCKWENDSLLNIFKHLKIHHGVILTDNENWVSDKVRQRWELPTLKCKRCGHTWHPHRPQKPKVCPKCTSPYWDKEYSRPDMLEKNRED